MGAILETPWGLAGLGLGVAAAAGGGGGGGGGGAAAATPTTTVTDPLEIIKAYATSAGATTTPTLTNYFDAGVKALTNLSATSATENINATNVTNAMGTTWLQAINSAVSKRTDGVTLTVVQLQALVDSYYRILSEADGLVNTTTNVDVNPLTLTLNDPSATDYTNIGATIGNAKSVDLLNDFVGLSVKTAVDTVGEINVVAQATYNVMRKAGVAAGTGTLPVEYSDTSAGYNDWVAGLTALGITGVNNSNIETVKAAIEATSNDGLEVDTVQKIKDLIKDDIALQVLRDYANATNGIGATVPTLTTYTEAGVKGLASLSETGITTSASADIGGVGVTSAMGSTWLQALNSALDSEECLKRCAKLH